MVNSSAIFLSAGQQKLFATGWPILTYHKIAAAPRATRDPFLYVSPARFEDQLLTLRAAGFSSGTLADFLKANGNSQKQITLTFDDGCENVLQNGVPILARHNFQAIQFLVSDFLGKRNEWDVAKGDVAENLMDVFQVKDWLAAGHEIGSHSATHPNLRHVGEREIREEIFGSKKKLEDKFGIPVRHFCYPFGSWNPVVRDLVQEAGYLTACTVKFGVNPPGTSPLSLRRIAPLSMGEWCAKAAHRLRRKILGS